MRRVAIAGTAAVLTAGGVAALLITGGLPSASGSTTPQASGSASAATAEITRQTLVDKESHDGSLGYGDTAALTTRLTGTVTFLPAAGATIRRGGALYRVDNDPVVLLYGTLPAYRALSPGVEGADVLQFERNLWALGHRGFTVDDEYTSATADAVEEWQEDLGLDETGAVDLGRVVYAAGPIRVATRSADPGAAVQPGAELLTTSATTRYATVSLDIEDQRLARKGARVDVTLPDGATTAGRITALETTVEEAENPGQEDTTKIVVTVGFDKAPQGLDDAAVEVLFVSSQRENVLTVPVNALVALAEGGYGVQLADGSFRAVETGLFADGRVEVTGAGLTKGTKVRVPA